MACEIKTVEDENVLVQKYRAEWKIDGISDLGSNGILTPAFSPLPNNSAAFCFKLQHYENYLSYLGKNAWFLKLEFIKLLGNDIADSSKIKVCAKITSLSGSYFVEYKGPSFIPVFELKTLCCIEDDRVSFFSNLIIKCKLTFSGHLDNSMAYYHQISYFKSFQGFAQELNTSATYKPGFLSFITLSIGNETLEAHKFILAAHSPVFREMMEYDFAETKSNCIIITDCEFEIFEYFLKYLYSGEIVDTTLSNVRQLYMLADKYDVQSLRQKCCTIIAANLTLEQICEVLQLAYDYNESILKVEAKHFAAYHFQNLFSKPEWTELVATHPHIGYEVVSVINLIPHYIKSI